MLLLVACTGPNLGYSGEIPPTIEPREGGVSPPTPGPWRVPEGDQGLLYGDELVELELELTEESIELLARNSSQVDDAPWVPAVLRHGDESLDVTLKLKGGGGSFRTFDEKPSLRVDFTGVDPDARFHGLRGVILNNLIQDESMLGEHLGYRTSLALGLTAGRHGFASLTINDAWYGLYGAVEPVDHAFLERWWPGDADGLLLQGSSRSDLVPGGEDHYDVVQDGDITPLYDVIAAIDATTPETYFATLGEWFDTDALLAKWGVEIAIGDPDAYVQRHNNTFLYWHGRWEMLPWGSDQAFTDARMVLVDDRYEGALYLKCLESADCEAALREELAAVVAWWGTGELRGQFEAARALTEEACLADPRSDVGAAGCTAAREALDVFIADRPTQLE